jgi:PAS domain S-box-containing protein
VVEQAAENIFLVDTETKRILEANTAFYRSLGYTKQELLQMTLYDIVAHDRESVDANVRRILKKGHHFIGERRYRSKDGSLADVEVGVSVIPYHGRKAPCVVAHDKTERKRTEKALIESERRFRQPFENFSDALFVHDEQGLIMDCNAEAGRALGYSREELLAGQDRRLRAQRAAAQGWHHLSGRGGRRGHRVRRVAPDLRLGSRHHRAQARRGRTPPTQRRAGTARPAAHRPTRGLQQRAGSLQLFGLARPARPLRAIDGFSQILLEDYEDELDEEGRLYLKRTKAASQRMGQLIDDLLDLSRMTRGKMRRESVDLSALARAIAEEFRRAQPEHEVEVIVEEGLVANGDGNLLRVMLENVLGNAWKFTRNQQHPGVEFGLLEHEETPTYYVRDNGVGFDMACVGKLFKAFQRLHSAGEFEGTGIGLATVQRIFHRHGGRMWAEGGKGATFFFTL